MLDENSRDVMVKELEFGQEVKKFEIQSLSRIQLRTNILRKFSNTLILSARG